MLSRILIKIIMWSAISRGILMLNTCLCPIWCVSLLLWLSGIITCITGMSFLSPFSFVDSGTSGELEVEGEHTTQFFIQIQKDKPWETVCRAFQSSFYMADQQAHPSPTVECAACLTPGNNAVYGMSGLFFIFWTIGIPKDYW